MRFLLLCALAVFAPAAFGEKVQIDPPAWLRTGVIYEVFPRDFSSDGTFNGITARLDDLKQLGVKALWIMPVNPIGEKGRKGSMGSPYSVKDYYGINPAYGTAEDLKRLVAQAHARDMKVILDVVLNHTSWDSVLMEHRDFYKQDGKGNVISPNPAWTDVAGLNYGNPELRKYIIAMLKHWIDPAGFDFDGFRCDVAAEVPTSFWEETRAELVKTKPDIIMLAEASKPELMVKAFDIDYSWPLLSTLNHVLIDGAPASDLQHCWEEARQQFPDGTLHMRITDDHDEARAVARYGVRGALAASALMFTLDGVPLLYNGMEAGDATESGDPALFEKLPVFWEPKGRSNFRAIYSGLAALRRQHAAFCNDDVVWLQNSDARNVVSFERRDEKDEFVVVINFSNRPETASVEAAHAAEFTPAKIPGLPGRDGEALSSLRLGGFEWRIYHRATQTQTSALPTGKLSE